MADPLSIHCFMSRKIISGRIHIMGHVPAAIPLKGIAYYDYGYPTCEQVEEYLTLALHLLQRMKPLMTREEEEWEERMDKAVDSGQGEKMMQQLRLIASK